MWTPASSTAPRPCGRRATRPRRALPFDHRGDHAGRVSEGPGRGAPVARRLADRGADRPRSADRGRGLTAMPTRQEWGRAFAEQARVKIVVSYRTVSVQ